MYRRAAFVLILVAAGFGPILPLPAAAAQDLPAGPIRLWVGFPAGSNADLTARVLAEALTPRIDRAINVETHPGRSGLDMAESLARSAPDGATLGIAQAALAVARHTAADAAFDLRTDVTPISLFAAAPMVILVAPDNPAHDLRELADAVRARPEIPCASEGGTIFRLTLIRLLDAMGVACRPVQLGSAETAVAEAVAALQAGRIHFFLYLVPATLPAVRKGQARFLALTSGQRSSSVPDVPTAAEAGLPKFEATGWFALVGPPGLPAAMVARLELAVMDAARDPVVAARLRALGAEPVGSTAAELAASIRTEDRAWGAAARADVRR